MSQLASLRYNTGFRSCSLKRIWFCLYIVFFGALVCAGRIRAQSPVDSVKGGEAKHGDPNRHGQDIVDFNAQYKKAIQDIAGLRGRAKAYAKEIAAFPEAVRSQVEETAGKLDNIDSELVEISGGFEKEKTNHAAVKRYLLSIEEEIAKLKSIDNRLGEAKARRKDAEIKKIEVDAGKIDGDLIYVKGILKELENAKLDATIRKELEEPRKTKSKATETLEKYRKAKDNPTFSEQSDQWLNDFKLLQTDLDTARSHVDATKTKHEAGIKTEIEKLAGTTTTSLSDAEAAKAAMPKDDQDSLNEIEKKLKSVRSSLEAYDAAINSKRVVVDAETLRANFATANTDAKSAKTLADAKRAKHETVSKTTIQSEQETNATALDGARERLKQILKGDEREFSKDAVKQFVLAELAQAEGARLQGESDEVLKSKNWLQKKDEVSKIQAQVKKSVRDVNQHAAKIDEICQNRERQLWKRRGVFFGGVICLFGVGGYSLYRGRRRHMHLKRENLLFGGFTEEHGIVRIEAGPEGNIHNLKAPEAFKKRLGYTATELAKLTLTNLFAPASRPDYDAARMGMAADGKAVRPKRIQCQLQTKEGGTVQVAGVLLAQRDGGPGSMVALLEDVSWRDDLADAQARIAALSFRGKEGLLLLDDEQRIVVVNPAFCQWFGLTKPAGELRGLPVEQLGPNFNPLLKDPSVITGSENVSKSIQVGGVSLQAEATSITAASRQAGRAIFFRDVTAEVQADEKLRPLMERFRDSTPENFHIGMAVIAPDGSVLAASQSMCNFFGYSREELLAQNEQKLRTSGNGAEAAKGSVSQVAVRRSYRRKDGSVVTARVQMTECRDERGAHLYSTMSIDDRGASPAPPKPAVWMSKDATEAWCPAVIAPHLPWAAAGFKYEDNYADQADAGVPGWHLSGATRRGRLHAQHGTHREDAFCWETGETFTIACVSDGAGAYKYSRIGSESICRDVTRLIRKALDESKAKLAGADLTELTNIVGRAMQESVRQASTSLHELAVKAPCEIKDFRCTMLLVVQYQHASGAVFLGSQVGDGFIQGLMQDGTTQRFGTPDSGKFSGEVSCFLPEVNAVEKAYKIFRIPHEKLQTLLLCTDGIEDAFFPIEKAAEGLFRQLNNGVQQKLDEFDAQKVHGPILGTLTDLVALQAWLDFEKRGENDDRTVLVLHRQPSVSTPPAIAPG
jgi:PAS domain S-box-containing protein